MSRWAHEQLDERFWKKVSIGHNGECWDWKARRNKAGYGKFTVSATRRAYAHRIAYELHYGEIPEGCDVCHRCDNPPCCNPDHLFAGTRHANMIDAFNKGRLASGLRLPQTKVTDEQVCEIIRRISLGETGRVVGADYGITQAHVSALTRGRFRSMFGTTRLKVGA